MDRSKTILAGKKLTLYNSMPTFEDPELKKKRKAFRHIVRKAEITVKHHFLRSSQCFFILKEQLII